MANVLHRATFEYLRSVNTPEYDPVDWIINPVLPDCPRKYWKIAGDSVLEMDEGEKAAVDLSEVRSAKSAQIDADYIATLNAGYEHGTEVTLAATFEDQTRFTQDALLTERSVTTGILSDEDTIAFLDHSGSPHLVTVAEYRALLVSYGLWCREQLIDRATRKAQLAAATTLEEIEAV